MFIFSFCACCMTVEVFLMNNTFFSVVYLIKMFRMWCNIIINHLTLKCSIQSVYILYVYHNY